MDVSYHELPQFQVDVDDEDNPPPFHLPNVMGYKDKSVLLVPYIDDIQQIRMQLENIFQHRLGPVIDNEENFNGKVLFRYDVSDISDDIVDNAKNVILTGLYMFQRMLIQREYNTVSGDKVSLSVIFSDDEETRIEIEKLG